MNNKNNLQFLLDDYPKTGEINYNQYDNIDIVLSQKCSASKKKKELNYFQNQNILNCDKNNSSRACPILFCNIDHKMNEVCDRVCPNSNGRDVLPDYRPSIKQCKGTYYEDKNNDTLKNFNMKDCRYFRNIDHENDLKNIVNKIGCDRKFYPKCLKTDFNKNNKLSYGKITEQYKLSSTDSRINRYPVQNCINFETRNYCPNGFKCVDPRLPLVNYQNEEIQHKINQSGKGLLQIGPIRCHSLPCQLDWNNVTKRHYNPNPTPYKFPTDCKTPLYEFSEPVMEDKEDNPNLRNMSYSDKTQVYKNKGAFQELQTNI